MSTPTNTPKPVNIEDDDFWVEETDEVMFQPQEIVPNATRTSLSASDLQLEISKKMSK